jgi:hypothetical protein
MPQNFYNAAELCIEYGVKTENQLARKLWNESFFIECIDCGKTIWMSSAHFPDGDPHCTKCMKLKEIGAI